MLILCRHGRTATNAAARIQGRVDTPLDPVGRAQALALAAAVGPVDRVVSSPLVRAVQTAEAFGVPVEIDERWIELDYGDWDERLLGQVSPEEWARWRADPGWVPPGGESLAALGDRVREACVDLTAAAARHDIVVVSHVSPIKAAVAWALGVGDDVVWRMHLAPASISRVVLRGGTPVLFSFDETAHLSA
jgi:broad specificity phosphatase PhoE